MSISCKGFPQGGAEHIIHIATQGGQVDALPGDACGVDDLCDPFRIPEGNGHGKSYQQIPHPRGEPSHEPEINQSDAAVREEANVARVRVRMEEAVHEHLLVGLLEKDAGNALALIRVLDLCDRNAFEVLHHDDARGTELCIDFRDDQPAGLGSVCPEGLDRSDLVREVEFFLHGRGELVDPPLRVVAAHLDDRSLEHPGNAPEKIQVRVDHLFDLGPPDLDHHLPAVFQPGPVHLADRCGGHRLFVDPVEDLLDASRQVPVQFLLDLGPGEGRHVFLKPGEGLDEIGRQDIRARGEQLPELDEDRAEFLEHHPEPFARGPAGVFVGLADLGEPGHRTLRDERAESVTGDDAHNLCESRQVHGDRSVSFGSDQATSPDGSVIARTNQELQPDHPFCDHTTADLYRLIPFHLGVPPLAADEDLARRVQPLLHDSDAVEHALLAGLPLPPDEPIEDAPLQQIVPETHELRQGEGGDETDQAIERRSKGIDRPGGRGCLQDPFEYATDKDRVLDEQDAMSDLLGRGDRELLSR